MDFKPGDRGCATVANCYQTCGRYLHALEHSNRKELLLNCYIVNNTLYLSYLNTNFKISVRISPSLKLTIFKKQSTLDFKAGGRGCATVANCYQTCGRYLHAVEHFNRKEWVLKCYTG